MVGRRYAVSNAVILNIAVWLATLAALSIVRIVHVNTNGSFIGYQPQNGVDDDDNYVIEHGNKYNYSAVRLSMYMH